MEDDLDSGLFNIALSDDETGGDATARAPGQSAGGATKSDRTAQSLEDFLAVKKEYRAKLENGEIWKSVQLPLKEGVSKPAAQEILHAVEELYFFRRYDEAAAFVRRLFAEGNAEVLEPDTKGLLKTYEAKCLAKSGDSVPAQAPSLGE